MSNPTSSAASSVQPTRQQLDELEALMQRMLDLPVNQLHEPTNGSIPITPDAAADSDHANQWAEDYPPPPAEWGAVGLQRLAAELPISTLPDPMPGEADPCSAPQTEWSESPSLDGLTESEQGTPVAEDSTWAGERVQTEQSLLENLSQQEWMGSPAPEGLQQTSRDSLAAETEAAPPAMPPIAAWLRPLVWVNLAFDGLTHLFGPLGRWLRGPTGRALIGWIGVLLLAAAMAWAWFDWMGWTW